MMTTTTITRFMVQASLLQDSIACYFDHTGNPKLLDNCSSSMATRKKTRASTRLFVPYFEHKTFVSGHSVLGSLFDLWPQPGGRKPKLQCVACDDPAASKILMNTNRCSSSGNITPWFCLWHILLPSAFFLELWALSKLKIGIMLLLLSIQDWNMETLKDWNQETSVNHSAKKIAYDSALKTALNYCGRREEHPPQSKQTKIKCSK
jgi:hypothetical protein